MPTQILDDLRLNEQLVMPSIAGVGIKTDVNSPTFPWKDLIGLVQPSLGAQSTKPAIQEFQTGIWAYAYDLNDRLDTVYHIPHDWVPDHDALIHLHWGNDTALVENDTFTITPTATYADRDGAYGSPVTLGAITYTVGAGGLPQHSHIVTEVPLCLATPSSSLDSNDINVDGLIIIGFVITTLSVTGDLFIFTGDIHYQSTGVGTKNNASPFWG